MQETRPLDSDFLYAAPHALGVYRVVHENLTRPVASSGKDTGAKT